MSLTTTVGSASADSYASVAEADAYHAARLFVQAWTGADTTTKEAALKMAARLLDVSFVWTGTAVDGTQALCWPRSGMLTRNGYAIATTTVPGELKAAQAEFARQLIVADRSADNDVLKQSISSLRAGPVALTFKLPGEGDLQSRNADVMMAGPEFAWISRVIPDAVSALLVDSWFTRPLLTRPILFGANR